MLRINILLNPHKDDALYKLMAAIMRAIWLETPPRAWGKQCDTATEKRAAGNTPTGVGKTANYNQWA